MVTKSVVVQAIPLALAYVLPSCSGTKCGPGTTEVDGQCVPEQSGNEGEAEGESDGGTSTGGGCDDECTTACDDLCSADCRAGEDTWTPKAAAEVGDVPLDDAVLDAIETIASDRNEPGLTRGSGWVAYAIDHGDKLYFIATPVPRILVTSACSFGGLGMVHRLDGALKTAAEMLRDATSPQITDEQRDAIVCGQQRRYLGGKSNAYSRVYLESWTGELSEGTLEVPSGSVDTLWLSGCAASCAGFGTDVLVIDGDEVSSYTQIPLDDGTCTSYGRAAGSRSISPGTHPFSVDVAPWCCYGWGSLYFELFGVDMASCLGVSVGGSPQPLICNESIAELDIPD